MLKIAIPKLYYTAGEPLSGEVTFSPNKPKKIKSVVISLTGYEHTEWADTNRPRNTDDRIPVEQRKLTHNRKRRTVIQQQVVVFPPTSPDQKNSKPQELEGAHTWQFSFTIPENAPPSMSYREGKVRIQYTVKVVVDPKWRMKIEAKQIIRVGLLYAIDPNIQPKLIEGKKQFLLAKSDSPVVVKARLNKEVTFSGDELIAFVDVDNQSSKTITAMIVKLKQFITFGEKKEKRTLIRKVHKQGLPISEKWKYQDSISIQIPKVENMPTTMNAALVSVKYHIAIHFAARVAKRLIIELPFILSAFPPLIIVPQQESTAPEYPYAVPPPYDTLMPPSYDSSAPMPVYYDSEDEDKEKDRKSLTSSSTNVTVPWESDNTPTLAPVQIDLVEIDNAIAQISFSIKEIDSASLYAQMGELEEMADVLMTHTYESCQSDLMQTAKQVASISSQYLNSLQTEEYKQLVKIVASSVQELMYNTKQTAALVGDTKSQLSLLAASKTMSICCQQLLLASKMAKKFPDDTTSQQLAVTALSGVNQGFTSLQNVSKMTMTDSIAKQQEVNIAKAVLQNTILSLSNPFIVEKGTVKEAQNAANDLTFHITRLLAVCNTSHEQTVQEIKQVSSVANQLIKILKGVSSQVGDSKMSQDIWTTSQNLVSSLCEFITVAAFRAGKSGQANLQAQHGVSQSSDIVAQSLTGILTLLATLSPPQDQPAIVASISTEANEEAADAFVMNELENALKSVKNASSSISLNSGPDFSGNVLVSPGRKATTITDYYNTKEIETNQQIIEASRGVTEATEDLVEIAITVEKERSVNNNSQHRLYRSASRESIVSAAKRVSESAEKLVASLQGTMEEEKIVSCAKLVASSTAQLVSASSTFATPDHLKTLSEAAKAVAYSTSQLVSLAKSATEQKEKKQEIQAEDDSDFFSTQTQESKVDANLAGKVKHFEQHIKIKKLEKELEHARDDLGKMNKAEYLAQ